MEFKVGAMFNNFQEFVEYWENIGAAVRTGDNKRFWDDKDAKIVRFLTPDGEEEFFVIRD